MTDILDIRNFVVALHGPHIRLGGNFYLHPMEWKIDLTEPLNQVKLDGTGLNSHITTSPPLTTLL